MPRSNPDVQVTELPSAYSKRKPQIVGWTPPYPADEDHDLGKRQLVFGSPSPVQPLSVEGGLVHFHNKALARAGSSGSRSSGRSYRDAGSQDP